MKHTGLHDIFIVFEYVGLLLCCNIGGHILINGLLRFGKDNGLLIQYYGVILNI